jgi:hypothetical protein
MKRYPALFLALLFSWCVGVVSAGSVETVPGPDNASEIITLEADLSANNSTLWAIPLDLGMMDAGQWLMAAGLSSKGIHGWNAQTQTYVRLGKIRPGEGFLLARGPGKISVQGRRIVADSVALPLEKGWNLIGVPYEAGIPLAALRITLEAKTESYIPAAEKKWVGGVNTLMDGKLVPLTPDGNAVLEPWHGYWLYAYQPCMLHIPSLRAIEKSKGGKLKSSGKLR